MTKRILAIVLSVVMLMSCSFMCVSAAVNVTGGGFKTTLATVDAFMAGKSTAQRQTIYDFLETYVLTDAGMDTLIGLVDDQSEVSQLIKDYIEAYGVSDDEKDALKLYLNILKCVPTTIRRTVAENWHDRVGFDGYDAGASYAAGAAAIRGYLLGGSTYEADGVSDAVFYQMLYNLRDMFVFTADLADPTFEYEFYGFTNEDFKNNIESILLPACPEINGETVLSAEHFMMILCDIINADAGITVQMKKDFAETLVTTNSFVYASEVTALSIATANPTTQMVGALTPVVIDLTATKLDDAKGGYVPAIEWYVNGELVQYTGESYTFNPTVAGTFTVQAKCDGVESNALVITIKGQGTIVVPSEPDDSTSSGSSSSSSSGTGSGNQGTVAPAQPNIYPAIPDPSKVGFVTMNNSTTAIPSQTVTFDDVQDHWAQDYIEVLATAGFLRGHSTSNYAPDFGVTREEMAVILVRVLGIEGQTAANPVPFDDHDSIQPYAEDAIYKLVELGIYKGYSEGYFAPQKILTREEISALFSRILGQAGLTTDVTFADHHEIAEWFEADVENLVNYGVVKGYPDASFCPKNDVTRGEAAVMLYNTLYRLGIIK